MKIKLLAAALLATAALQAQEVSFKWAPLQNNKAEGLVNPTIALPSTSGFYTYSYETALSPMLPNHVFLNKFDADAKPVSAQNFELPKRNKREATLKTTFESSNGKKLFFVSDLAINNDHLNILYAQVFDAATDKVAEAVELDKMPFEKLNNSGGYLVAVSADQSKLAVIASYPQIKEGKEKLKVLVFDNDLKKIWEKEYTLEHPSERGYNEKLFVTNQGQIVLSKIEDESKKEPKISVLTFTDAATTDVMIAQPEFYPSEYKITESNGEVFLAGYYTDNWKPTISMGGRKEKGVFVYNISKSRLLSKNLWPESHKKDYNANFIGLKVLELSASNGDFHLVGDQQSVKEEMDKASTSFASNFTYTTAPGVVSKVNAKGELVSAIHDYDQMKYVNKMGKLTSFYPLHYNNKLYLLTNDSESKLKGKKVAFGQDVYNKTVTLSGLNEDGTITVAPIWESGTGGKQGVTWLAPTYTRKIDANTYYVYAIGNEYQAFGKMTIK